MTACGEKKALTGKQQLVYQYIEHQLLGGANPSIEEILRWTQPGRSLMSGGSSIKVTLKILQKKGWIKMSPAKHRSIQMMETP
mgnify:CR=1 FL=1